MIDSSSFRVRGGGGSGTGSLQAVFCSRRIWVVNWLSNRRQEKVHFGARGGVTGVSLLMDIGFLAHETRLTAPFSRASKVLCRK